MPSASRSYWTAVCSEVLVLIKVPVWRSVTTVVEVRGALAPSLETTRGEKGSDELDDGGDAHAAADAERGEAAAQVTALELVDQGAEDHRAGRPERVAHRD